MTTLPIPIGSGEYRNVDDIELVDESSLLLNCYINEKGSTVKRPGLRYLAGGSADVRKTLSSWWWETGERYLRSYVYSATDLPRVEIYKEDGGVLQLTNYTGYDTGESAAHRTSFCSNGTYAFVATRGQVWYVDDSAGGYIDVANCPTLATHIAWLDGYLLANISGTQQFIWSDLLDPFTWDGLSLAQAVGAPDNISALHVFNRQIYLFGKQSLEIWENDGETPFSRIPGGYIDVGCSATYSIVTTDDGVIWLGSDRRFRTYNNGSLSILSTPVDREIRELDIIHDCFADKFFVDGMPMVRFSFPSAQRDFVYNQRNQTWAEWTTLLSSGEERNWEPSSLTYCPTWNLTLAQCVGGRICAVANDAFSDSTINPSAGGGEERGIRFLKRTGAIDYGTTRNKRSNEIRVKLKRGSIDYSRMPKLMFRFKDDNRDWSQEATMELGYAGETELVYKVRRTGIFQTRQYEFSCTDDVPVTIISAEEDFEILR